MYEELKKLIVADILSATGLKAVHMTADDSLARPYITFSIDEIGTDDLNRHVFQIVCDGWDKNSPKALNTAFDALDIAWKNCKHSSQNLVASIYTGSSRGFIEDEDKAIQHLHRTYDMIVYRRS